MSKHVVILGSGESGFGAALLAKAKGMYPFISDANMLSNERRELFRHHNIEFEEGGHSYGVLDSAKLVIKSPGISDEQPVVKYAYEQGIPVISEIEFAYRYLEGKCIGITGTNGKTTTTLLTYHLLKQAGLNVGLGGNIGNSLARLAVDDKHDLYVVEISSFQLDNINKFKADTAVLLNITPDHLDRYNYKMANYVNAKFKIAANQKQNQHFIYNQDDPVIMAAMQSADVNGFKLPISVNNKVEYGAYLEDKDIIFHLKRPAEMVFNINISDVPIKGPHNLIKIGRASCRERV